MPRVYDIALELISHSHGRVDGSLRVRRGVQAVRRCALGELWAIPIMLRLRCSRAPRRVVASVTAGRMIATRGLGQRMLQTAVDGGRQSRASRRLW
jgi:hypothetical protein